MKEILIVLDGKPTTGKSTFCRIVAKNLSSCSTILDFNLEDNETIPKTEKNTVSKILQTIKATLHDCQTPEHLKNLYELFLKYNFIQETRAKILMKNGKSVAMERNHISTFACCYAISSILGFDEHYKKFFKEYLLLRRKGLLEIPDFYFWLEISMPEWKRRRELRGDFQRGIGLLWDRPKFSLYYKKEFFRIAQKCENRTPLIIDSSNETLERVSKRILSYIIDSKLQKRQT